MRIPELDLQRNLCLTAGAGAGKTTCLVDTYLGLLQGSGGLPPLRPGQIAAITFTDKAAAEMKSRVADKVRGLAGPGPGDELLALLPELEWAPISTIHSFCGSLLREHGMAMGLEPDFGVLDAHAQAEMMEEAAREIIQAAYQREDPAAMRLLGEFSPSSLAEELCGICGELSTLGLDAARARERSLAAHQALLDELPAARAALRGAAADLQNASLSDNINKNAKFYKNLKLFLSLFDSLDLAHLGRDDFANLGALLAGNWGKLREYKDQAKDALELLDSLVLAVPLARQKAGDLLELAEKLQARASQEETRRAALSFDRLLLAARDLLRDYPAVLSQSQRQYRALLVDEQQDVNPVQAEIIDLLAGDPGQGGPRLMVVGDPKQSIYAFRGAAVELFEKNRASMQARGDVVASLPENYRSCGMLVDLFNKIFEEIFQLPENKDLLTDFAANHRQLAAREKKPARYAGVEVLDITGVFAEKQAAAIWQKAEAGALAGKVARLLGQGAKPSEIAVLFRRLTKVEVYENALKEAAIPFYTIRGGGFYASQEIRDLRQAMAAALFPQDQEALAALLRSPLVGLSDETLFCLVYPNPESPLKLHQGLAQAENLPDWLDPGQRQAALRAAQLLENWREIARRQRPAELVEAIVEQSNILAVYAALSDGAQKNANLRKLLELARAPQAGGVAEFVAGLSQLIAAPPKDDSQAPLLGEDAAVVRLMTVHQAKGLQFPIVILPDLRTRLHSPSRAEISRQGILAPKARDFQTGALLPTPLNNEGLEQNKKIEEAEAARLFYVACTRAEERLVFCLSGNPGKQGWAPWVEQYVLSLPDVEHNKPSELPETVAPAEPASPQAPGQHNQQAARELLDKIAAPPGRAGLVTESVSGLEDWLFCPRRYFFTRVLGLDSGLLHAGQNQGGGDALALGNLVHKAMESADFGQGMQGIENAMQNLTAAEENGPDLREKALSRCGHIWQSPLGQLLAKTPAGSMARETGFYLHLSDGQGPRLVVRGFLDLLIRQPGQPPLVADYKIAGKVEPDKYLNQMLIYCLALWKSSPEPGILPRAGLCFAGPAKAEWRLIEPTREQLSAMEERLLRAARGIASMHPSAGPGQEPAAPHCDDGAACSLGHLCRML